MRRQDLPRLTALASVLAALLAACTQPARLPSGEPGAAKSPAVERAARRAYDGAPPVVPHAAFGMRCVECHNAEGREVAEVGFAPPSPHEETTGLSQLSYCSQCHVRRTDPGLWRDNRFAGLPQDLRHGRRHSPGAPPVMPHPAFMRENCQACHSGPAAREEIRTSHPERLHCRQCHVEQRTREGFAPQPSGR